MQKFRMQFAVMLVCSATAFSWAGAKDKQKVDGGSEQNQTIVRQVFDELFNKRDFELVNRDL